MGISTTEYRAAKSIAKSEEKAAQIIQAQRFVTTATDILRSVVKMDPRVFGAWSARCRRS
jgi:glutathione synthase/RimK-type ligase-like ATP-grasp enzyme